jgi:hypothetical protein
MIPFNYFYAAMGDSPMWLSYLVVSILLAYVAAIMGVIVGKAGYSPFLGFLGMLPGFSILMLAWVAWGKWKRLPNRDYSQPSP